MTALANRATAFDAHVAQLESELVRVRRHLHTHPEASGEEVETTRFICDRLAQAGIAARTTRSDAAREVGCFADVDIGNPADTAPRIAVRADIDALRIPDEKSVEYRSQKFGLTHACGHDVHASILLGVALAAAAAKDEATVHESLKLRLLFQPAEETSGGARWLVDQGAMDQVAAVLGIHVDPERAVPEVGLRYGVLTANCDEVTITVTGLGGHAARPHHARDPVAAAAHLITSLYQQLPRSVDVRDASVFTVGQIDGGFAPNVIPGHVTFRGTLRTTSRESRDRLKQRIGEIAAGVESITGTLIEVRFEVPLDGVDNAPLAAAALEEASLHVVGADNVKAIERPSMGGEDFSCYLQHAPGAMLRLGCAQRGTEQPLLHSPHFDVDESCIALGSRILLRAALLLSADERLAQSPSGNAPPAYSGYGDGV